MLGAAIMQITSHNKYKHMLQRDSSLIAVITFTILLLVAFLSNTCVQILKSYGYSYLPDSFGESFNSFYLQNLIGTIYFLQKKLTRTFLCDQLENHYHQAWPVFL